MDPTLKLCEVNFETPFYQQLDNNDLPRVHNTMKPLSFEDFNIVMMTADNLPPLYTSTLEDYYRLNDMKDKFHLEKPNDNNENSPGMRVYKSQMIKYYNARDKANPFEMLGNAIFATRAAVKMANVDAIYNLTNHYGGIFAPQTFENVEGGDKRFTFCDIAGGPGGFSQYILWRRPEAFGYGISLENTSPEFLSLNWNEKILDMTRFKIIYGNNEQAGKGNLYYNYKEFADTVKIIETEGVDLCVSDGGFDVDRKEDYPRQEFLSIRLIMCEFLTSLLCLKPGGRFVCKLFDTLTDSSAHMIYVMSTCFNKTAMIKLVSTRPANAERYIVFEDFVPENAKVVIDLFKNVNSAFDEEGVTGFESLVNQLPKDFIDWLVENNDFSISLQTKTANNILAFLEERDQDTNVGIYDIERAYLYWAIPSYTTVKTSRMRDKQTFVGKRK
jgi:23S rRNA U2552 (ribose-2'-O)-methylase RlmE/FtsJ